MPTAGFVLESRTVSDASPRLGDHLANERTFLAWVRTSLGVMAFGFVVERFALFLRRLALILDRAGLAGGAVAPKTGFSSALGVAIIALGALLPLAAYARYRATARAIDGAPARRSPALDAALAAAVAAAGLVLAVYLALGL